MFELDEKAFKQWFEKVANDKVEYATVRLQAWKEMEDMSNDGETPCYELEEEYTRSGNVEVFRL